MNHWTFLQNKTEKEKTNRSFLWKWFVLIFWSWPVICVFVQRGWRSSKRTPLEDRNYNLCKRNKNNYVKWSHWVPTLLFPLYPQASHHFATWSKVDQIDWRHLSLIVNIEVWLQDDPMRHSVTLWSLIFAWTALSGFQSTGIPFFAQAAFSGFRLAGCIVFFISSLTFSRTLLVRREALIFS